MKISGKNGTVFEMVPRGFEAFISVHGLDHRFWLLADFSCTDKKRQISGKSACLVGYEVKELLEWLDYVADGQTDRPLMGFMEPHLLFELLPEDAPAVLRVSFEFSGPYPVTGDPGPPGMVMDFDLRDLDLQAVAESLRDDLQTMPARAKNGGCLVGLAAGLMLLILDKSGKK